MKEKVFTFFKENIAWMISICSVIVVCLTFIMKFIKYVYSLIFFNYYGINYGLFDIKELNFLYSFSTSLIYTFFLLVLLILIVEVIKTVKSKKRKKYIKRIIIDLIIIVFLNALCAYPINSPFNLSTYLIRIVVFMIVEFLSAIFVFKEKKSLPKNLDVKDYLTQLYKTILIYICFLFILISSDFVLNLRNLKTYNIINDDKVIVYSNNDYYIVLNCELNDNELIIHKGEQTKISNNDVMSKQIIFDSVTVK